MRVVNRTAVTVVGAKPYTDWTLHTDADVNKGALTVARAKPYGTAYLLPELELEEDVQEWVEENASWLFEFQLSSRIRRTSGTCPSRSSASASAITSSRSTSRQTDPPRRTRRHEGET